MKEYTVNDESVGEMEELLSFAAGFFMTCDLDQHRPTLAFHTIISLLSLLATPKPAVLVILDTSKSVSIISPGSSACTVVAQSILCTKKPSQDDNSTTIIVSDGKTS